MPVHNSDIAQAFNEIADLLELQDANPFRIRAYRNAARMLSELGRSVKAMLAQGEDPDALPGIGPDLAGKIREIAATGRCGLLDQLRAEVPAGLSALLKLPQLGPKRVHALHQALGIQSVSQLRDAALDGRLHSVRGFGPSLQRQILGATQTEVTHVPRFTLNVAEPVSEALLKELRALPGVDRAEAAGSLRRGRDTVGDLDLLVQSTQGQAVVDAFVRFEDVRETHAAGSTRASVVVKNGMQVDLRVVDAASFGAAWVYFTGAKAHNIALRRLAQDKGLKVNEYGVFRGEERVAGSDEDSVYRAVGLPLIAPELREDRGEFEAARLGRLPNLVRLGDLRGDLHVHTRDSDGHDDLQTLVEAARAQGLSYLAITDHSHRLAVTHGLDGRRLEAQMERIDRFNETLKGFRVLKGIEVDILDDGRLDLPDSVLKRLDLVVGAIHHHFELPRGQQTERLLRAMDNRHFTVLAHPSSRLLEERPAMDIDLARVVKKARERGCFLELNAHPSRLDLTDFACQMAKAEGVLVAISSDAHSRLEFENLRYGVGQARRGWLEKGDVLNARDLDALRPLLARTM